jgi:uncharacterized protein
MKKFYEQFKTQIVTVAVIFVALFLFVKLVGPIPFFINSVNTTKTDLFTVSGEGKAVAIPDQATVNAGITVQATTVAEAQNKVNQTADKIIKDLKQLGLSDKDIKTTNYSVYPNYGTSRTMGTSGSAGSPIALPMMEPAIPPVPVTIEQQQIVGYTVTQNLEIKVKPIEKANKVVDAVTADGANQVGDVNFTFSDNLSKSLEQQATEQAVNDAKQNAQSLANISGIHLGKIVNVVKNSNQPRPLMMAAGMAKTDQASAPTNVTPGENTLTVDVSLYYETY